MRRKGPRTLGGVEYLPDPAAVRRLLGSNLNMGLVILRTLKLRTESAVATKLLMFYSLNSKILINCSNNSEYALIQCSRFYLWRILKLPLDHVDIQYFEKDQVRQTCYRPLDNIMQ
jgi:hypothetical protein